jgi:surfactin synthase thioesterase subunit/acyl carrier protein
LVKFRQKTDKEKRTEYQMKIHPGLIDACAQAFHVGLSKEIPEDMKFMVTKWKKFFLNIVDADIEELWAHIVLMENPASDDTDAGDYENTGITGKLKLFNSKGIVVGTIEGMHMQGVNFEKLKMFQEAMSEKSMNTNNCRDDEFYRDFLKAMENQRKSILVDFIKEKLSKALEMEADDIDAEESLVNLGMDSLVGIRFHKQLQIGLGIDLAVLDLAEITNVNQIADFIIDKIPTDIITTSEVKEDNDNKRNAMEFSNKKRNNEIEKWIFRKELNPEAKIRLFCFPYGMKNADLYEGWQKMLAPEINVCPVQLPGFDLKRVKEKYPHSIEELVDTMEKVFTPLLTDLPCAFYGHSWGALLAYRFAYRILKNPQFKPLHLFVGAYSSPSIYPNPAIANLMDKLKLLNIKELPGEEDIIKGNLDIYARVIMDSWRVPMGDEDVLDGFKMLLPNIIAGMKLVEAYKYDKSEKFNLPITAFIGIDDDGIPYNEIKQWQKITKNKFNSHMIEGDHLFIDPDQSQTKVGQILKEELYAGVKVYESI